MSGDNTPELILPPHVAAALDTEILAAMDRSCALALKNQLNKNETDPQLKALADKWRTMDAFSKRELGEKDQVKTSDQMRQQQSTLNAVQVTPGQRVEVTGPATVYGGQVEDVKPNPSSNT